ncbi:PAQR family membrane homeostasis protein TrhA [Vallicoccus soli]|uniref:Hemolysin III family protein n=1 Tax=Vallicoccus soli TaxID=2339232 RepID=A0A3A3Z4U0_9ACTN|nr:hemolysin III family protein [Vallicoccus soli]RJK97968.1 hemolysin III family protein [Vallicoccus soli]
MPEQQWQDEHDEAARPLQQAREAAREAREVVEEAVDRAVVLVKPRLRGWLHAGIFPLALVAGVVLVLLSPTPTARVATGVFALTAVLLFGVSAVYHRGTWRPRAAGTLKRLDHANIFLIIAGTYTPFGLLLLHDRGGRTLLWIVWTGALLGVAFRVLWIGAPRWLYTPVYIALGWVAAFYVPDILATGGAAVTTLLLAGGALYSIGAVVYGLRRPDPSPRWFGFHEVFHAFTLAAFALHFVAVALVVDAAAA